MGANVSVIGMHRVMGGTKESVGVFRKHHDEVGNALLNISGVGTIDGQPHDKDDPRPAYVPQSFPKMIYHAEKGELVVENKGELEAMTKKGYRTEPYPKAKIAVNDPQTEKVELQAKLKQKDGEIASLTDLLTKMSARLDALESAEPVTAKK